LAQVANGHRREALLTLAGAGEDPESQILTAELTAVDDPVAGLRRAMAVQSPNLNPQINHLRWGLIGELALKVGDTKI